MTGANQTLMLAAMGEWEKVANVRFRPRSNADGANFVHIQNNPAVNNSTIGRGQPRTGQNLVNIVSWGSRFIMAHELAHTLGFWHEQSRGDRVGKILPNLANVAATNRHNFDIHNEASHYGEYDFDSVMHYGEFAFALNPAQRTITVLPPWDNEWAGKIGQRDHLSYLDRTTMSMLYPYPDWVFAHAAPNPWFRTGSFWLPYDFATAEANVPENGTVILQPGTYSVGEFHSKPMTIRAPLGGVILVR